MKYYRPGPSYLYEDSDEPWQLIIAACSLAGLFAGMIGILCWGVAHDFIRPTPDSMNWAIKAFIGTSIGSYITFNGKRHLNNIMAARKWRKEEKERVADITAKNKANKHKQLLTFIENCKNEK